jgi:spermidine/putrescine transport system permease protein
MKHRGRFVALIGPPSLYLLLFFLLPMGVMVIFSFRSGTTGAARDVFTLANYRLYLANANFHRLLLRSAGMSFSIAILASLLAYPLAYYLAFQAGPNKVLLLTLIIIPTWTSYLLRIFSWKLILGSSGLLNSLLLWLGLIREASPILLYSQAAVIVTLVHFRRAGAD